MRRRYEPAPLSVPPVPYFVTDGEADIWDLGGSDGSDRLWRRPIFARLPEDFARRFARRYRRTWEQSGRAAANTELRESTEGLTRDQLKLSASDQEIRDKATSHARRCRRLATQALRLEAAYAQLATYVVGQGLTPPAIQSDEGASGGGCTLTGAVARMGCPRWWRRALRRELGRRIEHHAIRFGFVHRLASKYVSEGTLQRVRQQARLNALALASVDLENEEGEVFSLEDLVERSNANPYIRRSELMVRMAGTEKYALSRGDVGVFLTLTCPSRFHARYAQSGDENPHYDGSSPREAQAYLCRVWERIRAASQRRGLVPYGIRVAEPHHDGAPHWHLLVFIPPDQKAPFVNLCRDYALSDSPDEPGAQEKRFGCVDIDHSRGTATGYIAKYIAKNIDGYGMETDEDGDEITGSAERVRAWASTWGIRQFQFFGGPPVTVWRELRRLPDTVYTSEVIELARARANEGDWASYMKVMGGAGCKREIQPILLATQWSDRESAYGEPLGERVFGVRCGDVTVETRFHLWTPVLKTERQPGPVQTKPDVDINLYENVIPIRITRGDPAIEESPDPLYVKDDEDDGWTYTFTYTDEPQMARDVTPAGRGVG